MRESALGGRENVSNHASSLLSVRDLSLSLPGSDEAFVDGVNFSVERGETLCIVGESGCGKSLTALSLMGLLAPVLTKRLQGKMVFEGQEIALTDLDALRDLRGNRLTMIFQEPMTSLNPAFRIGDQIAECWQRHNDGDGRAQALNILKQVGIPDPESRLNDYPHQLSGGMRQRVMIAMALVNEPALVIADEPTTALDVTVQSQILDLVADLQRARNMGMMLITHDLGVVARVATTVAVMYAGRVVERGTVDEIFNNPQHPYTIGLMASVPRISGPRERLTVIPGRVPAPNSMPMGCRFATRCPFATPACLEMPEEREIADQHLVACHHAPIENGAEAVA